MELLIPLWLPILLSAVIVWIISAVVWMALPHHKRDFIALPDEDSFMDAVRKSGIKPGNYIFPDFRDSKAMKSEKMQKALNEGPVGHLSVWQTPLTMGSKMVATFVVYLVVSTLIAYLTRVALPARPRLSRSSRSRPPPASSPTASHSSPTPSGSAPTNAPLPRTLSTASSMASSPEPSSHGAGRSE